MLRILGSSHNRPGGYRRREFLRAGGLGLLGLALPDARRADAVRTSSGQSAAPALPGFGRAKRCLVLYVYGAWSQLDTFDPKPDAPAEIRGGFGSIPSCLPGVRVCEPLPRAAGVLDRCTLIRSMAHPW